MLRHLTADRHRITPLALLVAVFVASTPVLADNEEESEPLFEDEEKQQVVEDRRNHEASMLEDPEAERRARAHTADVIGAPEEEFGKTSLELYGSARVHAINTVDIETSERKSRLGDGNSRIGVRADWQFAKNRWLFGRYEAGVDVVENFSTRGDLFGDGGLTTRLGFIGLDTEKFTVVAGQNWSAYYQVAGMTDRFAIFGGSASGVYNAGTAGQFTGTGRAREAIQTRLFLDSQHGFLRSFKPVNLNLQYQFGQEIPNVAGEEYRESYGASFVLEMQNEFGIGFAYNEAVVPEGRPAIIAAGIDGDATALALTFRHFGERWYAAVLVADLDNMNLTDQGRYYNGTGYELFAQWEFRDDWWLIGGGNWLEPDDSDPDVGQFRERYAVLGARYTFRSFERMVYFEYRIDSGRLVDGSPGRDEFTVGVRWDFDK